MTVGFRPKARQVMEQESEHVYYQYWERRAVISASVDKAFFVNTIGHKTLTAGAFAGRSDLRLIQRIG